METMPGGPAPGRSFLSSQSLVLTVVALGIGCLLAVLWSLMSGGDKSGKDNGAEVAEKSSSGGSKALKKARASAQGSKAAASKPKAEPAAVPATPKPATPPPVVTMSDVEVSDGGPDLPQEGDVSPEGKPKKKKKRKPAKAEAEEEAVAEEVEEEAEEEEKIDGAALGLDGWTSVKTKNKVAAEEEAEEKTDKDKEKDKKKAEKVLDLRRRKGQINQQIRKLEEGLSTNSKDEETKALEARSRLQTDLEKVNRSILRLTDDGRGAAAEAAEAAEALAGDDAGAWQEGYAYENGDQQWWQNEWAGSPEWNSWGGGRGHSGIHGRNSGWEEDEGDWQDQEWWDSSASGSTGAKWKVKDSPEDTSRRGKGKRAGAGAWGGAAWWDDASWEEAGADASASSWQAAASESWADAKWGEDKGSRRERKGKGKGKEKKGEKNDHRDNSDEKDGPEGEEATTAAEETSQSPSWSPVSGDGGKDSKGSRRERKGKGKGKKEGKDGDDDQPGEGKDSWKGKDSKGKGKGKKGKKGKDKDDRDEGMNMEDWFLKRKPPKAKADSPEAAAEALNDAEAAAAGADAVRRAIAPLFGNKIGERPNWGDAESSDEDRPAAVARVAKQGRPAHVAAALKKSQKEGAPDADSAGDDGKWDQDLVAFMGKEALGDAAKFEEQLKYVPTWVRDKAIRRRKQLMHSEG